MSLHEYLQRDPACFHLAEGAIHAVSPLLEEPDAVPTLELLDRWAFELAGRMPLPWNLQRGIDALNALLFKEKGLRGDRATYDDPANAALPSVIARRRGLPIALSILWIDVARRLGFDAFGVGLPGHFIVGLRLDVGMLFFDPFHGGTPVDQERAATLVERSTRGQTSFHPSMLTPTRDRAILARLVRNLHVRFTRADAWEEALWTSTHLILLNPEDSQPYRDRAWVHYRRGDEQRALEDARAAAALEGHRDAAWAEWMERLAKG